MNSIIRRKFAGVIQNVLNGNCSADDAIREVEGWDDWPSDDRQLESAYHLLQHFKADEDIRTKDSAYSAKQTQALSNIANQLTGTAPDSR